MRDASIVRGIGLFPLFAGLTGLLILLADVAAAWRAKGAIRFPCHSETRPGRIEIIR